MVLEIGRVCMKLVGREAGMMCVILKGTENGKDKKSFVFVTGPKYLTGVKRRKVNVNHVEPTQYKLEIKEDENDEEVLKAWEKSTLVKKFNLKKPSAANVKSSKTAEGNKQEAETKKVKKEK